MSFYYGCSNCIESMIHAVCHETNPFTDTFYHFCNNCDNDNAVKSFNKMRRTYEMNKSLSETQKSGGRY